ncbi:MAG: hypothetical protein NTZ59_09155, partial [Bacteroidetes bacterium]|nr:hypothetical protein [Bacteroidota bacterium]
MKKLLTLMAFICFWANANAQYVNIPDSNFRNFLMQKYPSCFNSVKQMDTTCNNIVSAKKMVINDFYGTTPLTLFNINGLRYFKQLRYLRINYSTIDTISIKQNESLDTLELVSNINLKVVDTLPNNLKVLNCYGSKLLQSFTLFPKSLRVLDIYDSKIDSLPLVNDSLTDLVLSTNGFFTRIYNLPNSLTNLDITSGYLHSLPTLPSNLKKLSIRNCQISQLNSLPASLEYLALNGNPISSLPSLPTTLKYLIVTRTHLKCFPYLPFGLLHFESDKMISNYCVQNIPTNCYFNDSMYSYIPTVCNPTNNINHCQSFPVFQSYVYTDIINNKYPKHNLKLTLSNNNYAYTNTQGTAYINADSLGTYTITAQAPPLYKALPASYTHTFNSYDTLVMDTFALQTLVIKDSLSINITPINFAARPGFKYVYEVAFENVGTTVVNPNLSFVIDTSKYIFDSTNNAAINFSGNTLSYSINNFVPGQTNNFLVYGRVKPTVVLGSSLQAIVSITGGNASAIDTANTTVRGSFDPNDKQATPQLSVAQVADNKHWIDYTIRFENTGTDTAFTVVVADTLDDSKVQTNTLQLTGLSHNCKVSQKDKIVYFEFLNINLPDSNTNKTACNGFVNFRVKPLTTLVNGNIVPNKASIYFDYNEPIITNTAKTIIGSTLPLSLTALGAIPKPENNTILVYWNTANEINTSYFIIEQSTDARTFTACAEVAAIG